MSCGLDQHHEIGELERPVLVLLAEGLTDGDIADRLGVSRRAVRARLSRFYDRTGVRSPRLLRPGVESTWSVASL